MDGNIFIGPELMTPLAAAIRTKLGDIEAVLREHGAPLP